jgi:DNA-directed RNA polymerase beta' subunit
MILRNLVSIWHSKVDYPLTSIDVIIPEEKETLVQEGYNQVEEVFNNYNMGFITNNERYNQIIDIWTHTNARLTHKH